MFEPGDSVRLSQGSYTIVELIGSGGQGSVWRVERASDSKEFALKIVAIQQRREARQTRYPDEVIAALVKRAQEEIDFMRAQPNAEQHHIIPCLDHGVVEQQGFKLPALLMPLYHWDMSRYTTAFRDGEFGFTFARLVRWIEQVTDALNYLHDAGRGSNRSVHRDLKPTNILLNDQNDIFLIDFGIAKEAHDDGTTSVAFSHYFCAPEQRFAIAENDNGRQFFHITPAVDLYALGMVIYALVAGGTEAQSALNDETTKNRHDRQMRNSDSNETQQEPVGLLGEVGGLNHEEQIYLKSQLLALIRSDSDSDNNNALLSQNAATSIAPPTGDTADPDQTAVISHTVNLPQRENIATKLALFIVRLLSPWPGDRPTAEETQRLARDLGNAIKPLLSSFAVLPEQQAVAIGTEINMILEIEGRGLPSDLQWLRLTIDGQPVEADYQTQSVDQRFCLPANRMTEIALTLPAQKQCGHRKLEFSAIINDQRYATIGLLTIGKPDSIDKTVTNIEASIQQLWNSNEHEAALKRLLREEWLDSLEQAANTLSKRAEFCQLLKRLEPFHPDHKDRLVARSQRLEKLPGQPDNVDQKRSGKQQPAIRWRWILSNVVLVALLVVIGFLSDRIQHAPETATVTAPAKNAVTEKQPEETTDIVTKSTEEVSLKKSNDSPPQAKPSAGKVESPDDEPTEKKGAVAMVNKKVSQQPPPPAIDLTALQHNLFQRDAVVQRQAWRTLLQHLQQPGISPFVAAELKAIRKEFEKQTVEGLQSKDPLLQRQSFNRLNLLVDYGDPHAKLWLGFSYAQGAGVNQDLPAAWKIYNQAVEEGNPNAKQRRDQLEKDISTLLLSKKAAQRAKGYQVIEVMANAGDVNAQLWMGKRYSDGDGVKRSLRTAIKWYEKAAAAGSEAATKRLEKLDAAP